MVARTALTHEHSRIGYAAEMAESMGMGESTPPHGLHGGHFIEANDVMVKSHRHPAGVNSYDSAEPSGKPRYALDPAHIELTTTAGTYALDLHHFGPNNVFSKEVDVTRNAGDQILRDGVPVIKKPAYVDRATEIIARGVGDRLEDAVIEQSDINQAVRERHQRAGQLAA